MLARTILALERSALLRDLRRALAGAEDIVVELPRVTTRLWEHVARRPCDLLVISQARVPQPAVDAIFELCDLPDAPSLVLIASTDDPEERARLVAAGCQAVLDPEVSAETVVDVIETLLHQRQELTQHRLAARRLLAEPSLSDFVSRSPVMRAFMGIVERVVHSDVSLLILGETGVGKERLAQAIHYDGTRSEGPFIAINCGALPESLLESELFGHEQGAFTGATRSRRGCFELAHAGTVFLDEIGELPHHLQVKLLRVLQDKEFRRLGGERSLRVDVRVIAATNRDLELEIAEKRFRRDLYYRLSVMALEIPPLRERREDIPELTSSYIDFLRPRTGCDVYSIAPEATEALVRYSWPGNVRELVNVIERALLLCRGDEVTLAELPEAVRSAGVSLSEPLPTTTDPWEEIPQEWLDRPWRQLRRELLERIERAYLKGLLAKTGGRVGETARLAQMQTRSLFEKMRYYGLRKEDFRS